MLTPDMKKKLTRAAAKRARAVAAEQKVWEELTALMREAYNGDGESPGATFEEIGKVVGVTKARVYQVVTGNRGGKRKDKVNDSVKDGDIPKPEQEVA